MEIGSKLYHLRSQIDSFEAEIIEANNWPKFSDEWASKEIDDYLLIEKYRKK